jgi:hypothetical protein
MVRQRRISSRPQDQPIFTKAENLDFEKRSLIAPYGLPSNTIEQTVRWEIYYLAGIDGGDMGEPTPAMDYLLQNLNGGDIADE